MDLSSKDCAWSHVSLTVLSRRLTGLRGFEVKKTVEKEHLYASGDEPVDIQPGNKAYTGSFKVLKYEVDLMNDAAQLAGFADITEVPHELITGTIQYKKQLSDKIRTISIIGVAVTELSVGMEQNSKQSEVTLPWLAMRVIHSKQG